MPEEGFLRRWARRKSAAVEETADAVADETPAPASVPAPVARTDEPAAPDAQSSRATPTLDDVARLTQESDYSAFVAQGVDQSVRRMALKKLFADPHFNVMDGLDIYIDDYNKFTPLSAEMLAALKHAPNVLAGLFGDDESKKAEQTGEDEQDQQIEPGQHAPAEGEADAEHIPAQAHDTDGTTPPTPIRGNP
jgi:hypothetical protein